MLDRQEVQAYLDAHNIIAGVVVANRLREWRGWLLYDYVQVTTGLQQLTNGSLIVAHSMSEDSRLVPTVVHEDSLAAHFFSLWWMQAEQTINNWLDGEYGFKPGDVQFDRQYQLYKQRHELFYANWKLALRWELS